MTAHNAVTRTARLLALDYANQRGWLDGLTRNEIAARLGVTRATLWRDTRDLAAVYTERNTIIERLRPTPP